MVDDLFADRYLAGLYDALNPWASCDDFYLRLVLAARSVLDIGCGTGALLHRARDAGHRERLVGLDPADGMLARARRRDDIEWVLGDATVARWVGQFDLALMNGHVFQVLLTDAEIRENLAAVRRSLQPGGRYSFETRNPAVKAWVGWTDAQPTEVMDDEGRTVSSTRALLDVDGELVTFSHTFAGGALTGPRTSVSTLRFAPVETLDTLLEDAGLTIEERYGDWDGSPLAPDNPEIIIVATRSR